jgi:hypothetical protein
MHYVLFGCGRCCIKTETGIEDDPDGDDENPGCDKISEQNERIATLAHAKEFYRRRTLLLERMQKTMRDPERRLVCDILANAQLLPDPTGSRYGFATTGKEHYAAEAENAEEEKEV